MNATFIYMNQKKIQKISKNARIARKLHKSSGIALMVFILIVSVTGILLGWKKNSNELISPNTYKGSSMDLLEWVPVDSISLLAILYLEDLVTDEELEIDRIDIRPAKGVAKVSFTNYWMVQLDGVNGELLNIGKRNADIIEKIHDGSIVDEWLGTSNGFFKLVFTSTMGLALLLFIVTGFVLWYAPKQMKKISFKYDE